MLEDFAGHLARMSLLQVLAMAVSESTGAPIEFPKFRAPFWESHGQDSYYLGFPPVYGNYNTKAV